ncbi:hypothetical protein ASG73_08290 [Janibacter sp. Soil728]|uniref:hypothetical protein n=1 Tax=Janibacter sp. Soil728 TaxID=1736393 RepID=UPI0006F56C4B|nr:hypothetical protein [Janibacter sp. Soil728]KRE37647.1 hypothetical protein ASG73_08290 [Janibacter sp. Soil728]
MLLGLDVCVPVGVEVDDEAPDGEEDELDAEDDDEEEEEEEDDEDEEDVLRDLRVEDGELVTVWVVGALLVELE